MTPQTFAALVRGQVALAFPALRPKMSPVSW